MALTGSSAVLIHPSTAIAACSFGSAIGNTVYTCDSGTSVGGLTDTSGNNTLLMPPGGSGTVQGDVVFGAGADRIEGNSGTITGAVNMGTGADVLIISATNIVGNVQQGDGLDDFQMTGGEIGSLNQGTNLDTFFMSDGRIIDAFDDGDYAVMTGGRIGRVNLKLDNNYFNMSGGTIDRNLVAGFGNDTIILSDGTIGGNISVSGGTDSVTITGGSVAGSVLMSLGTDTFTWNGGGIVYGAIDLGPDNDIATLANLTNANIGATTQITGGEGVDGLTLSNVSMAGVARLQAWEAINLTNDTELTVDGTLTLGDATTGTGTMSVDASSTLFGGGQNGGIAAFGAGQLANLINAGRIDLTNGGQSLTDTFRIGGNYTGSNGLLLLQTHLGDDSSASDRLVISGGVASGATSISVLNVGGTGGLTAVDGIMVVGAENGATTTGDAFALNGRVAAGAFEYYLFKGGVSPATGENWYLRSSISNVPGGPEPAPSPPPLEPPVPAPLPVAPEAALPPPPPVGPPPPLPPEATPGNPDPVDPAPPVVAGDAAPVAPPAPPEAPVAVAPPPPPVPAAVPPPLAGTSSLPPTPGATPVIGDVVPLYRVEVATYSIAPVAAYHLGLSTLGTFHERRGMQSLVQGTGVLPASWGRVFGQDIDAKWSGAVDPSLDGDLYGVQAGQDLFAWESIPGHVDRIGLFFAYASMNGDVKGQALGWNDVAVGKMDLDGTSFGGSWTHIGPSGWYLDGVLMGTWYDGSASSTAGQGIDLDGSGFTASLEGGYPIAFGANWTLEPQAQIVWQHLSLDNTGDAYADVAFDTQAAVTGRLGARLTGNFDTTLGASQIYLKANLWHRFDSDQNVVFDTTPILTNLGGTNLELGGGVVLSLGPQAALFANAGYTTDVSGEKQRIIQGNVGLSVTW